MNTLLDLAIEAHGGWDRWQRLSKIRAEISAGGAIWPLKGHGGRLDFRANAHLDTQRVELSPFKQRPDRSGIYEPERTTIETVEGGVLDSLTSPRGSFAGHTITTPWNDLQLVYFQGYALWTYLTTPFLLKRPGFQLREIEPWNEGGERWRRLQVIFPLSIHSHSREQVFYFDARGLLRRHDYSVDIMGGTSSAHYSTEHQVFNGIVFPTKRRVYSKGADNRPLLDRVAVSIDVTDVTLE
jgi:hypothetical protein